MSWAVEVQQPAEKELVGLPSQVRKRIARALRALKDNPFPHGVKKLKARDGSILEAVTVVLKDVKPWMIVIGNPVRESKRREIT